MISAIGSKFASFIRVTNMSLQLDKWIAKRWQTDTRYYVAEIVQDLFGTWVLKRSWGGLRSRQGSSTTLPAENYHHATKLLADVEKRRKQRGYQVSE